MAEKNERRFTAEEAKAIGETLGIDWTHFGVEEYRMGLDVETEHGSRDPETDVTHDDPSQTGKIAWAHLKASPNYYTRLRRAFGVESLPSEGKTALVLGGLGIVGRNLIAHLEKGGWNVKAVSRRVPDFQTASDFRSLDLLQPESLAAAAEWLSGVTHVFFAAYQEKADPSEASRVNTAMLRNVVEAVERASSGFRHVGFIQGGKAYGAHLGMYETPAKETAPRHFGTNFYYDQEDYLREASQGKRWGWTALRPDIVFGFAVGNPMNLGNVLAVYASLCKEHGVPLRFPGTPKAYGILANATDATLLAKAMEWAALDDACHGEIFNITNGDVFRWSGIFPQVADALGIDLAPPQTFSLAAAMRDQGPVWDSVVAKFGLQPHGLGELANWAFGDFIFNVEVDTFFDVGKARRFGFHEMNLDTGEEVVRLVRELQAGKVIPA